MNEWNKNINKQIISMAEMEWNTICFLFCQSARLFPQFKFDAQKKKAQLMISPNNIGDAFSSEERKQRWWNVQAKWIGNMYGIWSHIGPEVHPLRSHSVISRPYSSLSQVWLSFTIVREKLIKCFVQTYPSIK